MLLRVSYFCVFLGILGSGLALGACSSDGGTSGAGAAGTSTTGTSGSTGVSGNGSGGSTATQGGSATAGSGTLTAGMSAGGMSGGNAAGGSGGGAPGGTSAGGASGAGGGGAPSKMSAGCNKDNADDPSAWTKHSIAVTVDAMFNNPTYTQRVYWSRPPKTYDKNKPIPLVMWGQGCGQSPASEGIPPMDSGAIDAAVLVQFLAPQNTKCYSAGPDGDNANSPELPYFDKVLADTLAEFCIDTSKIFMSGYSSGGWFSSLISCNRANVVRGVAWASAGLQLNHAACTGAVPGMIIRGTNDSGTPLDQTIAARDSLIMRNGCTMDTKPWDAGDATIQAGSCVEYQGCMPGYPVVWCPVPGDHTRGDTEGLSNRGFWHFESTLP